MPNTFEILARFLDRVGEEVEGREHRQLSEDVHAKLRHFAAGRLPASEQEQMVELLTRNPEWMESLASEVKALRAAPKSGE